jgi:hypothetical protein
VGSVQIAVESPHWPCAAPDVAMSVAVPVVDTLDVLSFAKWCDTEPTFYAKADFEGVDLSADAHRESRFRVNQAVNSKISLWCDLCSRYQCSVSVLGPLHPSAWAGLFAAAWPGPVSLAWLHGSPCLACRQSRGATDGVRGVHVCACMVASIGAATRSRADIWRISAEAIVHSTNESLKPRSVSAQKCFQIGGPRLIAEVQAAERCRTGEAVATSAGNLSAK